MIAAVTLHGQEALQNIVDDAWQGAHGYHFSGRLTEIRTAPGKDSSRWSALYRNTRMLLTSGEEGVVTWRVAGNEWSLRADDNGYWEIAANQMLDLKPGWHEIETTPSASSKAGLFVPDPRNQFGIISDIDDTILVSNVLSTRALLKNSLTVPAELRDAVPKMAALYKVVLKANAAPESSAVFYVSSSPRQLTDNLRLFLRAHAFPRGVLLLKEIGYHSGDSMREHDAYKTRRIETILKEFPQTKFYLFGDDGERDPEIYKTIAETHPEQIVGVWIRRVSPNVSRPIYPGQHDMKELLATYK
ncbi:MAG: DUF2183 domain-containing protein [Nibricoccus sp.]